jgi:hypothetical protein
LPRARAFATAGWKGAPEVKVRNCLAVVTAVTTSGDPVTHPTFHPVTAKVLPALLIETVRSAMPSYDASGWCVPSYTRCS